MQLLNSLLPLFRLGNEVVETEPFCGISCKTLVRDMEVMWREIGETEEEIDVRLHKLDKKCLEEYKEQIKKDTLRKECFIKTMTKLRAGVQNLEDELSQCGPVKTVSETSGSLNEQIDQLYHGLVELQDLKNVHQASREHVDRLKEVASKKQAELEEILARAHMEVDIAAKEKYRSFIDGNDGEPGNLFEELNMQIINAKEEADSRREILNLVHKWMSDCEEEVWLGDFSKHKNRFKRRIGAHKNLKRAEKARVLMFKIPAHVGELIAKIRMWEQDYGRIFTYDGVALITRLENDIKRRQESVEGKTKSTAKDILWFGIACVSSYLIVGG